MTPERYLDHLRAVYAQFGLSFDLLPPAGEGDLTILQDTLGAVDPGLVALWRMVQGSREDAEQPMFQRPGFVDALDFLSPQQAIAQAQAMQARAQRMQELVGPASADARLTGRWWEKGWLPFASFYADVVLLLDAAPGLKGQAGQVIAFVHDPDQMCWVAPSLFDYLQASADSIDEDREEFLIAALEEQGSLDDEG